MSQGPGRCAIRLVQVPELIFCGVVIEEPAAAENVGIVNLKKVDPRTPE